MTAAIQQILVHLDPSVGSAERLACARKLAGRLGATLNALYASTPAFVGLPYYPEISPTIAESLREIDAERRAGARKAFDEAVRTPGAPAHWSDTIDFPVAGAFAQQALYADLLVLGQHNPSDVLAQSVPPDFAEAVMIASGRPALVIPYAVCPAQVGATVAIAWKESREAARAVTAALPILKQAQKVHVLRWGPAEGPTVQGSALDLAGYLRRHGVEATWHDGGPETQSLGEILLSRTFDLGADLLVMGCYGHTRAREWILGGASRSVLGSMTLPVLMAH